jgi:two-component system, sensor histidine kinase
MSLQPFRFAIMKSSGFLVRKFRSAAPERAFRSDYARRYAHQRRLAGAGSLLLWLLFARRDWWLLIKVDPAIVAAVMWTRLAGSIGMTIPVVMLLGRLAFEERWVIALASVWLWSCWLALLRLMELYPAALAFREIFPEFLLVLFTVFTLLRLRAVTAAWMIGLCVVSFHLTLLLWPREGASSVGAGWASRGSVLAIMYFLGVVVCIQFERAARREFVFRRNLRAARARAEIASREAKTQSDNMRAVLEEKERFFSSAYHDIQQPLAAINLFIRSAQNRLEASHLARTDLEVIEKTARDVLDLFKGIQDYSELGSYAPQLTSVDTHDLLREVFDQYRESARARGLRFAISERRNAPPFIDTDRALFKRALSNLVSNAIKYTSAGGVVIGFVRVGARLRIDVRDSGIGIASAYESAIFAEYYQIDNPGRDRSKGLGLGLSIVHRVIDILPAHELRFSSAPGRGSRFSLYAPVSARAPLAGKSETAGHVDTSALSGRYVMLCDDDPVILEGLRRLFEEAGAVIDTAASMRDIEAILAEDGRCPDIVVTDIRLRDGPNGIVVAERIRQHFAWAGVLPVAFITGELVSPRSLQDFAQPFVLLRKSYAPAHTLEEVSRFVDARRTATPDFLAAYPKAEHLAGYLDRQA